MGLQGVWKGRRGLVCHPCAGLSAGGSLPCPKTEPPPSQGVADPDFPFFFPFLPQFGSGGFGTDAVIPTSQHLREGTGPGKLAVRFQGETSGCGSAPPAGLSTEGSPQSEKTGGKEGDEKRACGTPTQDTAWKAQSLVPVPPPLWGQGFGPGHRCHHVPVPVPAPPQRVQGGLIQLARLAEEKGG